MPSRHSQNVSLTAELQQYVIDKVATGRYRSVSEVIRASLRCLQDGERKEDRRAHSKSAANESDERLRSLAANMPSAMIFQIIASADGVERRFSFVAESCMRINGVSADQVIQNPSVLYEMILPEYLESFVEAEKHSIRTGSAFDCEVPMCRKDGVLRWHRISSAPRAGPDGKTVWDGIQVDVTDRKEAETARSIAVARSEKFAVEMAAVLGQLAEGVIVTDAAGKITYINDAAGRIHGVSAMSTLPEDYSDVFGLLTERGEPYPLHELPLARAVRGDAVTDARWRIRRRDETQVLAIGSAKPLLKPDGTQFGAVLTLRDDTARNASELKLQRSEALKSAILEAALDCIVTITSESRIIEWNPAAERTFGYPAARALGQDLTQLIIPPEMREEHQKGMSHYLATGEGPVLGQRIELEALRADGSRFPVELAIHPIVIDSQPHFTAYLRDISERRRTEAALRDSELRLRATYDHAFVGIAEVDPNGRFLRVNEHLSFITGFSSYELRGRTFTDITYEEDREYDLDLFRRQMAGQLDRYTSEKRYRHKDGHPVWIELSASRVDDAQGRPLYGVRVVRDISERKRAEEHRDLLINELNHRVKNTLATVQSIASQTLRKLPAAREAKQSLEARLFALARVHDVLTDESWAGANLNEIVVRAIAPYRSEDETRFDTSGPNVRLTPKMALALAMGLQELSTNAVKYGSLSNEVGRVSISWAAAAGRLQFRWLESGGPAVQQPKSRGFGTRLIERSFADDLAGDVTIDFAPRGLVCTVNLPLATYAG